MPIVKKLKFDIDGDGKETIIKVSINSSGKFSADVPLELKGATHKTVSEIETMNGAIERVWEIVREYQALSRTEKWVILIEFRRDNTPFLNEGISMSLNYAIANKKQFGKQVEYCLVRKDMSGEFVEVGNYLPTHKFSQTVGVIGGETLELEYTEEKLKTIEDLSGKLNLLCQKLSELCNSENQFMMLVSNTMKMLGGGS